MASNAASSVQSRVNGTEMARERTRKTERTRSADPRFGGVDAGELPNSYCVNDRTAGTSDDDCPRCGISNSRQLVRGRARRCRRLRHGCESLYRPVLSNFRRPIQSQPRTRCLRPSTSTLSESTLSTLDKPSRSPDCSHEDFLRNAEDPSFWVAFGFFLLISLVDLRLSP